ncbi:MAG: DMT family transporter [Bacillota bacterium]
MSHTPALAGQPEHRPALSAMDIALLGVALAWGFGYVAFATGLREIPTGLFNLVRYLIATPLFWGLLLRSGENWHLPRRDWPRTVATGLIGVLFYSMVFSSAAKFTTAANTSLLLALSPVWAVLMGWLGGRGAPGLRFMLGSLTAFGGAAMVIAFGTSRLGFSLQSLTGDLLALAASTIWAWYGVVAQPLLKEHSGVKVQAWISLVALGGFLLYQGPAALAFDWGTISLQAWLGLLYVTLIGTVFSHIVWYNAIARVGPARVLLVMYLVPAVAAASGALFLGQPFGLLQMAGGAIALAGVALVRRV